MRDIIDNKKELESFLFNAIKARAGKDYQYQVSNELENQVKSAQEKKRCPLQML